MNVEAGTLPPGNELCEVRQDRRKSKVLEMKSDIAFKVVVQPCQCSSRLKLDENLDWTPTCTLLLCEMPPFYFDLMVNLLSLKAFCILLPTCLWAEY